jgi:hypothetical protein
MSATPHLQNNRWLAWDYRLGFRGAGLIVYGTLPASLAALGAIKADLDKLKPIGGFPLLLFAIVAAAPLLLTFVLVRQRLRNWYLLSDWLWLRSTVITVGIVAASSAVCLAIGVLTGKYHLIGWDTWLARPLAGKLKPFMESLLLSFAYLVGSSTLFLTVIKEDGSLPLLPGKTETDSVNALRQRLNLVLESTPATTAPRSNAEALERGQELVAAIDQCLETIGVLRQQRLRLGRAQLYTDLEQELAALRQAAAALDMAGNWQIYWGTPPPANSSNEQLSVRGRMQRLGRIKISA